MQLKAVITAAAPGQRHILDQTLTTHDGKRTRMIEFLLDLVQGVATETAFIIPAGASEAYHPLLNESGQRIVLIEQNHPQGYAHAIFEAREFVGNHPFLHMVGDHFYLAGNQAASQRNKQPARTLVESLVNIYQQQSCSISAVQPTRESLLPYFGAVGGKAVSTEGPAKLYQIEKVMEKPTPTEAERELWAPGLRQGQYLCFFGMHIFTPAVMSILTELFSTGHPVASFSQALAILAKRERYLAAVLPGSRIDVGSKYGLLQAQLALGLGGPDREEVLSMLLELAAR